MFRSVSRKCRPNLYQPWDSTTSSQPVSVGTSCWRSMEIAWAVVVARDSISFVLYKRVKKRCWWTSNSNSTPNILSLFMSWRLAQFRCYAGIPAKPVKSKKSQANVQLQKSLQQPSWYCTLSILLFMGWICRRIHSPNCTIRDFVRSCFTFVAHLQFLAFVLQANICAAL